MHNKLYSLVLVRFALLAFIATQAIVPAGFMPSSIAGGFAFSYCPGDDKNRLIVQSLDSNSGSLHHHQYHHHHHALDLDEDASSAIPVTTPVTTSAADHCQFSLFSSDVTTAIASALFSVETPEQQVLRIESGVLFRTAFFNPHTRAPPA